ncbi:MAG TPA: ABC transporter ATP-binding protein [Chitinophagaceae bacterium]|nr:ABC transporter ATP-binding protein [Chitinophagaceae bacterium]
MSDIAIKVENVGKLYRLGEIGTGTLSHDLNRWWARVRGKEDPFAKVGETNDRTVKGDSDLVWALKDISFDIKQGEVLGIIGRNGAGKSTLLKLLSKVTQPTTGNIKVKGRIASLLEVGTGFHPDLTGRENVFLNGAILGMTKQEIRSKFDEIVDFAGVERYIDTPVKRYSSGMYVRLAFAVAAFLEPEILIIDEVLAVGDAEFQKKCLGRMKDVSVNDGRTVLFVSHNMAAIKNLCTRGLYLKHGFVEKDANIEEVIDEYFIDDNFYKTENRKDLLKFKEAVFYDWNIVDGVDNCSINSRDIAHISFDFCATKAYQNCELGLVIRDFKGDIVFSCNSRDNGGDYFNIKPIAYRFNFSFRLPIKHGKYEIDIALVCRHEIVDQWVSSKKLIVLSKFESHLADNWLGIVNEISQFEYVEEN